ncbi:16S rRNA (cytidine(1402)-2'-O)-methyltransferase [Heliorestis convoluta]|uniref:Ribosomal RNA small subunit methyltransferase I n=1 Tax=Heliorestis convoluta TaxID=356322 RepID=A0A5Q2N110_9FIRM|nr:16S rRNA (cytidine(1402)-2'-O)-methyltransferase [Heliorestis convoluta]QGG48678.1 16S rRNA (cytidine(1402)-2'-O)-methyltransferase [Heliorestis convoluta]
MTLVGKLKVCATPIGNLEDITLRVLQALREADLIAAEDTRHTRKLLSAYEIHGPLTSYHEHNKKGKGLEIVKKIEEGATVVLVSDAGLPGISDPGEDLIHLCIERNLPVEVLPGPSASITALVLSGLPTGRFVFEGFLPRQKKAYRQRLQELAKETRTIILYESPYRVQATLADLQDHFGAERRAALVRELTKKFEEVRRGTLGSLREEIKEPLKGECSLVIGGCEGGMETESLGEGLTEEELATALMKEMERLQAAAMDHKEALKKAAQKLGLSKREAYRLKLLYEER